MIDSSIRGFVRIYHTYPDGTWEYDESDNMVVARGRAVAVQRLFNISGGGNNWTGHVITHFAVGKGGSSISGNDVILNGPYICDTQLYDAINLGISGYLTEPGGTVLAVKPITASGGSLALQSEQYGTPPNTCTYYNRCLCTLIIPPGEPASLGDGQSIKIDEAGLYAVSGNNVQMFAHVCFAPKWKEKESTLTILWYVIC